MVTEAAEAATNIDAVLASFDDVWSPRIVAQVNDWAAKIAKVHGEFVWHSHPETDELFLVLDGALDIGIRQNGVEATVHLERNDVYVVPRGIEHRPVSEHGARILLLEPAATVNTGTAAAPIPDHIRSTTGRPAT